MQIERAARRAGFVALLVAGAVALAMPDRLHDLREATLDVGLAATAAAPSGQVQVIEITAQDLAQLGRWPWPRTRLARVIDQIAAQNPNVLGLDLVLSGPDPAGPLALSDVPGGKALTDGDDALQIALSRVPTVLAAALSDQSAPVPPLAPLLSSGPPVPTQPWFANGLEASTLTAAGLGVSALRGEAQGRVRRVPLLVLADQSPAPGFATEVVRLAQGASALRIGQGKLSLGAIVLPLGTQADLRIRPTDPAKWSNRTISLAQALSQDHDFSAKIVLLGLSAPQAASLRPTAVTPLAPSVQIQADAIETMLSGHMLLRPAWAAWVEIAAAVAMALLALWIAAHGSATKALAVTLGLPLLWAVATTALCLRAGLALDPVNPALLPLATGLTATTAAMLAARRHAQVLRRRFERHLSPAVVARIAAQSGLSRLPGEVREITALFTDIAGFSPYADALSPTDLIAILDRYFAGLTLIVHAHGGMVDKFVGDAAHVLFNAPFDLPDHCARAVKAGQALQAYGVAFAADPQNQGLGITRVGMECGVLVVGDVGAGEKLDYTAHGRAMNIAARLEQAGKGLGVTLLAGPALYAALPALQWHSMGEVELRGFGKVAAYTLPPTS
ncbi:CHASE2 domain-containing protein [Cypionkella psychrotolerans]|uniref:CHASE2 domain-containing protein n=1 Tax=Cypionkella psychrotolerans TaxID=1678131 RepID=UPI0006B5FA09|nr:adenylate/guanylate cyclase domain-containing protein [Cypionkella psychrotolerans]